MEQINKIFKNKKNLFYLFITGFLIFINWSVWIYAVSTNQIVDASFGYFIMPIMSVLFGYFFLKKLLNKRKNFFYSSNNYISFISFLFL